MVNRTRKYAVALLGAVALGFAAAGAASADTVKITILGVGDIYNFAGLKDRGGFARLNAVAKAEKAANPNTIYVFDGDMFSPSLLSGFDKGTNTVELTNLVPFDIAVPGNHEFDFGTDTFLANMKVSKYPWAAINLTHADGSPIEGLGGTMMKDVGGVKVALVPVAQDDTPDNLQPGRLEVRRYRPVGHRRRQGGAQRRRRDRHRRRSGATTSMTATIMASQAFDVIMSGDDHDYMTGYDGITAYVETSTEANYLSPARSHGYGHREGRQALHLVGADVPLHRHQDGDARSRDAGAGRRVQGQARQEPQRRDRHDRERARLAPQRRPYRRVGDGQPDHRRHARREQRRYLPHQRRRHPWRQGISPPAPCSPAATS